MSLRTSAKSACSRRERCGRWPAFFAGLLLPLWLLVAGPALAQQENVEQLFSDWMLVGSEAELILGKQNAEIAELEALRSRLVTARNGAQDFQSEQNIRVEEVEKRIEALGPVPEEGVTEGEDVAELRQSLNRRLSEVMGPMLRAQEVYWIADSMIGRVDRRMVSEFSAGLRNHGPSPLSPGAWRAAATEITTATGQFMRKLEMLWDDTSVRNRVMARLPLNLILIGAGLALIFSLRRYLSEWVEEHLAVAKTPRAVTWLLVLRNLTRIFVPLMGAILVFSALEPNTLAGMQTFGEQSLGLPNAVLLLIAAGWLAGSFFAPLGEAYRIVPLNNAEAWQGTRYVMQGGLALALHSVIYEFADALNLTAAAEASLYFPAILFGAYSLFRFGQMIRLLRNRVIRETDLDVEENAAIRIGVRLLRVLQRTVVVLSVFGPVLGLAGYITAARFAVFAPLLTLGLIGAGLVVFHVLNRTVVSAFAGKSGHGAGPSEGGLVPVVVALVVVLGCAPFLAMIWGVRRSEIDDFLGQLVTGVEFAGLRISLGGIVAFIISAGMVLVLTRVTQVLLRGTVLPRTKLDVGARNAVLAGVGYCGVALAGVAGISAAGLDLSSLALVAGALSVGIGFGLQTIVSNFVSGIILLTERPIKEGDWIEVGDFSGIVRGIRVRSTEIETFDRASVIVPNADLVAGTVLNRTYAGLAGRLIVPVGVSYDADPRQVERILMEIVEMHPLVLEDPPPVVLFTGFGDSSMDFELRCRLRDVNFVMTVRSDMLFDICKRFREEGIEIPFPQRDLHLRSATGWPPETATAEEPETVAPPEPETMAPPEPEIVAPPVPGTAVPQPPGTAVPQDPWSVEPPVGPGPLPGGLPGVQT